MIDTPSGHIIVSDKVTRYLWSISGIEWKWEGDNAYVSREVLPNEDVELLPGALFRIGPFIAKVIRYERMNHAYIVEKVEA